MNQREGISHYERQAAHRTWARTFYAGIPPLPEVRYGKYPRVGPLTCQRECTPATQAARLRVSARVIRRANTRKGVFRW